MFELDMSQVHSIISRMIIKEELLVNIMNSTVGVVITYTMKCTKVLNLCAINNVNGAI